MGNTEPRYIGSKPKIVGKIITTKTLDRGRVIVPSKIRKKLNLGLHDEVYWVEREPNIFCIHKAE
jgi:bifunctional DNA-binding transcriptional regulator/antitoxin component of YhaV-PrlF toxin-antitoxin module